MTRTEAEKQAITIIENYDNRTDDNSLIASITAAILDAYNKGSNDRQRQLTEGMYPRTKGTM